MGVFWVKNYGEIGVCSMVWCYVLCDDNI